MNNTKILLVGENLQHRAFNGSNQALPWLASALYNHGFPNAVQFDMENRENTLERLLHESESSDLILFAGTFSTQLAQIDIHTSQLKKYLRNKGKDVPIIIGGYGASGVERYAEHAPFIDAFFYGPGIEQVGRIADSIRQEKFYNDLKNGSIPGLSFFDKEKGRFIRGKPVPLPQEQSLGSIDQLFMRDYIPLIHDMGDIFFDKDRKPLPTFQLVTELGCPYVCSFCSESGGENEQMFLGRAVREIPLETIDKTFALAKEQGYKAVYFDIETAFRNWNRMERILEIMCDYGFVGGLNTRIDTTTKERIERSAKLGTVYTFYGVEHINPQVLFAIEKFAHRNTKKRIELSEDYAKRVEQTFKWMNSAGIQSSLFMIMGLPKIDNVSWKRLKQRNGVLEDLVYVPTTFEDDANAIREAFQRTQPYHFNANILRFNPDTAMAWQPQYASIRPSGQEKLDAIWFVPRVAKKLGIQLQSFHPVYRFFEGVETTQPFSTAMSPERAHNTAKIILEEANKYRTHVYFDQELENAGLVWKDFRTGEYRIAPLKEFEGLKDGESEPKSPNIIPMHNKYTLNRIGNFYKLGIAAAASLAIAIGSAVYVRDYTQNREARIQQKMVQEFYSRYNPGLLENGKLPPNLGMGLIDMLSDEKNAFVYGNVANAIYCDKTHLTKLVEEGREFI